MQNLEGKLDEIMTTSEKAKEGKNARIFWDEKIKTKLQTNVTNQFEEIYQMILAKEGRLKDTETGLSNIIKLGYSKITKENSKN